MGKNSKVEEKRDMFRRTYECVGIRIEPLRCLECMFWNPIFQTCKRPEHMLTKGDTS